VIKVFIGIFVSEQLIMETVGDEIPLLIATNIGARGLSLEIRSLMVVPLKIREKIFGVLIAANRHYRVYPSSEMLREIRTLTGGEVVCLTGDLGTGKTCLVQGIGRGLGVVDRITSPTFTLINEYPARLPLFHIDLYRLETVGDLEDIGLDELLYDQAVLAVEWADKLADKLFGEYLSLRLEIIADDFRKITLIAYGQNGVDLIKALEAQLNLEGAGRLILDPSN